MAGPGQRQRQLAAKAARRKAVVAAKNKAEALPQGVGANVRRAAEHQIARCLVPANLFESGIGHVIVSHSLPSGLLGCGFFLIDPFCLGVKDAFYAELGSDQLQARMTAQAEFQTFVEADPAWARKLIRDAAAYAADLGLLAAKDYRVVETIFGDIDAGACTETFTFGLDGKPFYVTGPLDTPARIRTVCRTLQDRLGAGGWDYLMTVPPA